jgi:hypothetical protein
MKPVTIDREAEAELLESVAFYESRSTGLGLEFEAVVRAAIQKIEQSPQTYRVEKTGARRFVVDRFPFIIHYLDLPARYGLWHSRTAAESPGTG